LLELGIVPSQLGSPVGASVASFITFVLGAAIPLLPWLIFPDPLWTSILISTIALMLVGGAVTNVTNRGPIYGAIRQLVFGGAAAVVTWLIGHLVGSSL